MDSVDHQMVGFSRVFRGTELQLGLVLGLGLGLVSVVQKVQETPNITDLTVTCYSRPVMHHSLNI